MTETVLGILAAVLCVAGAVSVIRWIALKFVSVESKGKKLFAVVLDGKDADIRLQMALQVLEWNTAALGDASVLAVDGGMSDTMADYCRKVCRNNRVRFVEKDGAEALLPFFAQGTE